MVLLRYRVLYCAITEILPSCYNSKGVETPPGFSDYSSSKAWTSATSADAASAITKKQSSLQVLRTQKAWDLAIAPAKAVPMQGFMVYMSGGGVQIFSLMIVYQLVKNAITGMMGVNEGKRHHCLHSSIHAGPLLD